MLLFCRKINTAVEELKISTYFENVAKSVSTVLQSREIVEIVCFGLGRIAECNISRYQLALLLSLRDIFNIKKVFVHDPIFYKSECTVLQELGINVIEENNEGNYVISDSGVTLVYLPHCPKQLTNNFLWSNWGVNLRNCVLICNSFNSLIENQPSRVLKEIVPFIKNIFPYTSEIYLENNFQYSDIFNDTSLHYFPNDKLLNIDSTFWTKSDKPKYEDNEEFISSHMIEKLNIF